jgi:UDP-N-acetylglucosamine--N-acetylmuramyl-(pentapeptide) pyrophosphoryl-undecaprenol N-acetylglucosamine transferase
MTCILLAAGGTGGHVFPAVAVAEQLKNMGMTPVFITDRRGKPIMPKLFRSVSIMAASPYGANRIEKIKGLTELAIGALQTLCLMLFYRPKMVIGFGGYPAVAPILVGKVLNRKTMLHEQNAYFGRANHFLANHVDKIALSWTQTHNIADQLKAKCIIVGMPVREAFHKIGNDGYKAPTATGQINILIVGGSLGAEIFGKTVPEALSRLPLELRSRLKVTHQVRANQIDTVRSRYKDVGIAANLATFIDDVAGEMGKAHLVVCRSGASSVAELVASGRPSILVPFPEAMDDHQTANAKAIVDINGGWLIPEKDMSAGSLAGKISTLTAAPEKLAAAAAAVKTLHHGHAASMIAKEICTLIGIKTNSAQNMGAGS